MIITKEHIGKKIFHPSGIIGIILCVNGGEVWIKRVADGGHETIDTFNIWQLVEEKKRPSERIMIAAGKVFIAENSESESILEIRRGLDEIAKILDEQYKQLEK